MSRRSVATLNLVLALAAGTLLNLLAQQHPFRADLTADKRFTLDTATTHLLHSLPEAVTVTAYFTGDLPPELAAVRQDFKDLLAEYASRSGGNLVFEFLDPGPSAPMQELAISEGVRPLLAQTRKQDRSENIQVLMGAVVRMGGRKAVIPALQAGPGMEWVLSSAIAQVTLVEKPLIGVMQGHEEPPLRALDELAIQLSAQYDVEATVIYDSFPINERFSSLLWIDPKDSITPWQLHRLDEYMAKGHGVVLAFSPVASQLATSAEALPRDVGLGPWLAAKGLRLDHSLVADAKCGEVGVMQSGTQRPISLPFPYYPLVDQFKDHPVAHGLDQVMFQCISPITIIGGDTALRQEPILLSSAKSAVQPAPFLIDLRHRWSDADFRSGPQVLGAAVERTDASGGRLVVFGNGNFCTGDQGGQQVALPKGNLDLMVNATDWVQRNTALLSIRGKQQDHRPIADQGEGVRNLLKWMNLLLPVVIVLLYGLGRRIWRQRQRARRKQPGHVR